MGRKTAREKIATFINMLVQRSLTDTNGNTLVVDLPMTRDQIANYIGLTLETVSRQFNSLKKEGVIGLSGRKQIEIMDLDALREATGDDAVLI